MVNVLHIVVECLVYLFADLRSRDARERSDRSFLDGIVRSSKEIWSDDLEIDRFERDECGQKKCGDIGGC